MAGERVIIVDDQESIRELLGMLCETEGYEVTTAGSGKEALEALERQRFDVGILDLLLPDSHGLDILRQAKELYPDIEVIILTGHSDLRSAVDALRLGAYDYMQKPLADLQIIPLTIRRALDKQQLTRHNQHLLRELRDVNKELERRRREQFRSIQQIGHALTGALQPGDVAQVVAQTTFSAIGCLAAACLAMGRRDDEPCRAAIASADDLPDTVVEALLTTLLDALPTEKRPLIDDIVLLTTSPLTSSAVSAEDAGAQTHVRTLALDDRDGLLGALAVALGEESILDHDAESLLSILSSQATIALQNAHLFARMQELATRDSLTGLLNHGRFFALLRAEISRAERHGQEVSVIMLDIDRASGLKVINDSYGHQAGDRLLRQVADLLQNNVRQADVVARYGGDEFIILAPQTGLEAGLFLGERLRRIIADTPFAVDDREERISVSVGVGVFRPGCNQSADTVVNMADQSCYLAKDRGGNQVATTEVAP